MICLYLINAKAVHVKISNSFASQDRKDKDITAVKTLCLYSISTAKHVHHFAPFDIAVTSIPLLMHIIF